MITSKLTSKAQTTIPQPVRAALHLKEGDEIAYEIKENLVVLTKASDGPVDNFVTFDEWGSEADQKAYATPHAQKALSDLTNFSDRLSTPRGALARNHRRSHVRRRDP